MISRAEIKTRAKSAFMQNYWLCVAIFAILSCVGGAASGSFAAGYFSVFSSLYSTVVIAVVIFAGGPFTVSHARASLNIYDGARPNFKDLIYGVTGGRYWKSVGAMALYTLFTALPTIIMALPVVIAAILSAGFSAEAFGGDSPAVPAVVLAVVFAGVLIAAIPSEIISLGLRQTPYVVAEEGLSGMAAVKRSWELMRGHKWELFVFGWSFFGWSLLTAMTQGVLGVFYVGPYMSLAYAGYYRELTRGTVTEA